MASELKPPETPMPEPATTTAIPPQTPATPTPVRTADPVALPPHPDPVVEQLSSMFPSLGKDTIEDVLAGERGNADRCVPLLLMLRRVLRAVGL
jgi:hypothetical protein